MAQDITQETEVPTDNTVVTTPAEPTDTAVTEAVDATQQAVDANVPMPINTSEDLAEKAIDIMYDDTPVDISTIVPDKAPTLEEQYTDPADPRRTAQYNYVDYSKTVTQGSITKQVIGKMLESTNVTDESMASLTEFEKEEAIAAIEAASLANSPEDYQKSVEVQRRKEAEAVVADMKHVDNTWLAVRVEDIDNNELLSDAQKDLQFEMLAKRVSDEYGILDKLSLYYRMNRAQYETGGMGPVMTAFYQGLDDPNGPLYGFLVRPVQNIADVYLFDGTGDTSNTRQKLINDAQLEKIRPYIMEADGTATAIFNEIITDPLTYTPWKIFQLGGKALSFAVNFGAGASLVTFLQWLKDDDRDMYEWVLGFGAGGTINGLIGLMLHRPVNVSGVPAKVESATSKNVNDAVKDELTEILDATNREVAEIAGDEVPIVPMNEPQVEFGVVTRSMDEEAAIDDVVAAADEVVTPPPTAAELLDEAADVLGAVDNLTPPAARPLVDDAAESINYLPGSDSSGVQRTLLNVLDDTSLRTLISWTQDIQLNGTVVSSTAINRAVHTIAKLNFLKLITERGYNFTDNATNAKLGVLFTRPTGGDIQTGLKQLIEQASRQTTWNPTIFLGKSSIGNYGRGLSKEQLKSLADLANSPMITRLQLHGLPDFLGGKKISLGDLFTSPQATNSVFDIQMSADGKMIVLSRGDSGQTFVYSGPTNRQLDNVLNTLFEDVNNGMLNQNLRAPTSAERTAINAMSGTTPTPTPTPSSSRQPAFTRTGADRAEQGIEEIGNGNIYEGVEQLIASESYFTNPITKQIYQSIGKVFEVFKDNYTHKFPMVSAGLSRRKPENITPQAVVDDVLNQYNSTVGPGNRVWVRVDDIEGRTGYRGIDFYIYSEKQLGGDAERLFREGGRTPYSLSTKVKTTGNKFDMGYVNTVSVGGGGEGQLMYHILQELVALKKGSIKVDGTLLASNRSARPLHLLSTVLNRKSLVTGIKYQNPSASRESALSHFTHHRGREGKTWEGFVGSAVMDLIKQARIQGAPEMPIPGRPQTGTINAKPIPPEIMARFGFDSQKSAFTMDGVAKTYEEIAALYEREIRGWLSSEGLDASYAFKGFNTQIRVSIIGKQLLKDLVDAGTTGHAAIIRRYKTSMNKEIKLAKEIQDGTRQLDGSYVSKPRAFSKYVPASGLLLPMPLFADSLEKEAEEAGDDSTWGIVAGTLAVALLAIAGRKGYKAFTTKMSERAANKKLYGGVRQETLDKLNASILTIEEKLQDDTLSSAAKARLRVLRAKTYRIRDMVSRYNSVEHLVDSLANREVRAYVQSKAKPVVRLSPEGVAKIKAMYDGEGEVDLISAADNFDFNFSRIDTTEEVESLIETVSQVFRDEIDVTRRGVVSLSSIEASAKEFGFDVQQLNNLFGGTTELAERFTAARMLLLRVGDEAAQIGEKISENTATELDKIEFTRLLGLYSSIHAQVKGSQTEIARALTSMRITSRLHRGGSAEEIARILQSLSGREGLNDVMKHWLAATHGEREMLARNIGSPSMYRKAVHVINEVFINGILGGLTTHMVNIFSNSITAFEGLARHMAIAESGMERFYVMKGFMQGIVEAGPAGWRALKRGSSYLDVMNKVEVPDTISASYFNVNNKIGAAAVDTVGNLVRIPSRFLAAEDDFFKMISYRMKLSGEAYRHARMMGLKGSELNAKANDLMKDADFWLQVKTQPQNSLDQDIVDIVMNFNREHSQMLDAMTETSIQVAREQTFTNELGAAGKWLQNMPPEARIIMPFVRTPINIMKFFGNRVPLINAIGNKAYRNVIYKKVTGQALTRTEAQTLKEFYFNTLVGGALLTSAAMSARNGNITGMAPNKRDRTQVEAGWKPYSRRVWDSELKAYKYIPYNRMDPVGMFLGVAADISVIADTTDRMTTKTDEMASAVLMSFVNNFIDKTYLSGVMNIASAISSGNDAVMTNFFRNQISSFVPKYLSTVRKATDPYAREVFSLQDAIKNQLPGLSQDLTPRRDYRGQPLEGPSWWNPNTPGVEKTDPVNMAVRETGVEFTKIPKTIHGTNIEYTAEQYDFLTRRAGEIFQENAENLVTSARWNRLTDSSGGFEGSKQYMLKEYMNEAKQLAMGEFYQKYPETTNRLQEFKRTKIRALSEPIGPIDTPEDVTRELQQSKPKGAVTIEDLKF
jgi:hypothetical protein